MASHSPRGPFYSARRFARRARAAQLRARRAARRREELACSFTHGLGLVLAVGAVPALVLMAALRGTALHLAGFGVFGGALVLTYGASTLYHAVHRPRWRRLFRVLDHAAIYLLIAGTYTPVVLIHLDGALRWALLGTVWALAAAGVVFKVFYTGRYARLSLAFYLAMGWLGLVAARPILEAVPLPAVLWLAAGGVLYTAGVAFFVWERLPYHHAVWHLFVLAGSVCHFVAVAAYAW
jgi:hemolysin III